LKEGITVLNSVKLWPICYLYISTGPLYLTRKRKTCFSLQFITRQNPTQYQSRQNRWAFLRIHSTFYTNWNNMSSYASYRTQTRGGEPFRLLIYMKGYVPVRTSAAVLVALVPPGVANEIVAASAAPFYPLLELIVCIYFWG
jgi:hypothetical protein